MFQSSKSMQWNSGPIQEEPEEQAFILKVSAVPACYRKARPSNEVSRPLQELAWPVHSLCLGREPSLKTCLE